MSQEVLINQILKLNKDQMSAKEYGYIADIIRSKNGCNLLVFGVGIDSKLWLSVNSNGKTVFLEDSEKWLQKMQSELPYADIRKVNYGTCLKDWKKIYLEEDTVHEFKLPEEIRQTKWEIIIVDGPNGYFIDAPGRMLSIFTASKLGRKNIGSEVFVHDIDRITEHTYCKRYFGKDELITSFERLAHFKIKRKKPLKILFATTHSYIPQRAGGSESSTHDLCKLLIEKGFSCAVLADLLPGDRLWNNNRRMAKKCNHQFPVDFEMGYPVFRGPHPIDGVHEIAATFKPDAVIVQAGLPLTTARAFRLKNIPTIIYIRDVEFHEHGGDYNNFPGLYFFANSKFTAERFYEKFNLSAIPIVPLIDSENYQTQSTREKVLFVCPHPLKGVEIALQLAESNPQIDFIFLESWPLDPILRKHYIIRAKKSGNIEWHSRQKDMKQFYSQARIVLMPSVWEECWGRIITEAQASGIPALASNIGGLPESVADGGILVNPASDISIWSSELRKMMNDNALYESLSQNALKAGKRKILQTDYILNQFIKHISEFLLDFNFINKNTKRNQPCPCGLGRKFKHCHGKSL